MYFPKIKNIGTNPFLSFAYQIHQQIITTYSQSLPLFSSALLKGVVLGVKMPMPKNFIIELETLGLIYIIAASGMNVTMVAAFLERIFSHFFTKRVVLIFSLLSVLFYAIISGLQPSILRVSCMISIVFIAGLLGRQYTALYCLFMTTTLLLVVEAYLLTSLSFQLSVLSTLGILMIKPLFPLQGVLGDDVGTKISPQFTTTPLIMATFGY